MQPPDSRSSKWWESDSHVVNMMPATVCSRVFFSCCCCWCTFSPVLCDTHAKLVVVSLFCTRIPCRHGLCFCPRTFLPDAYWLSFSLLLTVYLFLSLLLFSHVLCVDGCVSVHPFTMCLVDAQENVHRRPELANSSGGTERVLQQVWRHHRSHGYEGSDDTSISRIWLRDFCWSLIRWQSTNEWTSWTGWQENRSKDRVPQTGTS